MPASLGTGLPTPALPFQGGWDEASFIICIVMPILAAVAVAGRFYTRRLTHVGLGIDDWFVLGALLLYWVQSIIAALAVPYGGVGHHIDDLTPDRIVYLLKLLLSVQYFYCSPLAFAKASFCFFLLRIFGCNYWFRRVAYVIIAASACFMLFNILTASFTCQPITANWDKSIPGAHCGDEEATFLAVAVFDVVIDIAIIILPMPIILSLQMSTRDKLSIMALVAFGAFDTIAAIMRIIISTKVDFAADWTMTLGELWFWSVLEPGMAICVVCLVVMRPLLDKMEPRRQSIDTGTTLHSMRPATYYLGDDRNKARAGTTTVEAASEPYNMKLEGVIHDDDSHLSSIRKEDYIDMSTECGIVVSREVHITTEDRR